MKHRSDRVGRVIREMYRERQEEEGGRPQSGTLEDLSRLVREFFGPRWKRMAFGLCVTCLWAMTPYAFSLTWRFLIDDVLMFGQDAAPEMLPRQVRLLWVFVSLSAGIWVFWGISFWLFHWASVNTGLEVMYDFRKRMHEKLQALHIGFYQRNPTGRIMSRVMDDAEVIRNLLTGQIVTLTVAIASLVAGLCVIFYLSRETFLLVLIAMPAYALTLYLFRPLIRKANIALRQLNSRLYALSTERISGIQVVSAFGREKSEMLSFSKLAHDFARLRMRSALYSQLLGLIAGSITGFATVAVIYVGALRIRAGDMSLGDTLAIVNAAAYMFPQVGALVVLMTQIQACMVVIHRVFRFMDEPEEVVPGAVVLKGIEGKIAFDHATFTYPDQREPALEDFSLSIPAGQKVALMGPSGSGKSTVFYLLLRFYDPQHGEVRVGGVNLRDADPGSVRRHICMVQQEPTIFAGTIADNIAYGVLDATPEQIMQAAQRAELHEFIMSQPAKYETEIGENGISLSGGQKQRLALATALLADPEVLLLDDTTSALDAETEIRIRRTLEKLLRGRTSLICTHRVATARECERIVVLDRGRISQDGTHSELLLVDGFYRRSAVQQGWVLTPGAEGG